MNNTLKILSIPLLTLFCSGCLVTTTDIKDLKTQIAQLNQTITSMQENQADLNSKIGDLSADLSMTNENINETGNMLTRLSAKLDDLSVSTNALTEQAKVTLPTTLFENAKKNLNEKNYDAAIEGFDIYLKKFPEGELVQEAQYLKGDAYTGKKAWKEAAIQYATLMQKYPKSKSTPSYRLKYAQSIIHLNKKTEAKKYLQSIVQDYPKSSEAKVASRELGKLK